MTYDEVFRRVSNPVLFDLRHGGGVTELYWLRDVGVPTLLRKIAEQETLIDELRAAVAREGAMNQEGS